MKKAVIIQARMGSTRLPGKVLMNLNNKPCLQHIIERCKRSKLIDEIIVVCTNAKEDQKIISLCEFNNVSFFIGKGTDVLNQVLQTALHFKVDLIVEITADCPLVDPFHIDILIKNFLKKRNTLYASNVFPRTFPDGFDIQVYKTETLDIMDSLVTIPEHRRHVGWNIMTRIDVMHNWSLVTRDPRSKPEMRLTLDTIEDYTVLDTIFREFGHNKFSFPDVLSYIQYHPQILEINKNVQTKIPGRDG